MRKLYRIFFLLLLSTPLASLFPIAAGGQNITRERNFEGDALYGYMNGGSDLFFEYGFVSLNVLEVKFEGFDYTVETYTMADDYAAFGIYSIHIFKPLRVDSLLCANGLGGFDCLSKYQLQAAYGNRYFSIVFNAGPLAAAGAQKLLLSRIERMAGGFQLGQNALGDDDMACSNADVGCSGCGEGGDTGECGGIATGEGIAKGVNIATGEGIWAFLGEAEWLKPPFSGRLKYVRGELGLSSADESALGKFSECCSTGLWIYSPQGGGVSSDNVFFTISPLRIL